MRRKTSSSKFIILFNVFHIFALLMIIAVKLLGMWFTIYWKGRKIRKTFENELIKHGVPKNSAKEISAKYIALRKKFLRSILRLKSS